MDADRRRKLSTFSGVNSAPICFSLPDPSRRSIRLTPALVIRAIVPRAESPEELIRGIRLELAPYFCELNAKHGNMPWRFREYVLVAYPAVEIEQCLSFSNLSHLSRRQRQKRPRSVFLRAENKGSLCKLTKVREGKIFREWAEPKNKVCMAFGISCWSNTAICYSGAKFPSLNPGMAGHDDRIILHIFADIHESPLNGDQRLPVDIIGLPNFVELIRCDGSVHDRGQSSNGGCCGHDNLNA